MQIEMQQSPPVETTVAAPEARGRVRLAGRVASWALIAAATLVAIGLAAITIGPRFLPYQALVVRSGSMEPTIPTGSVVFYHHVDAQDVAAGDVIAFTRPGTAGQRITHRVLRVEDGPAGRYFVTKGDANGAADDWRVPAVGTGWEAAFHVPYAGYVLAELQSTTARLLLLVVPAGALALITLLEIWQDRRRGAPG